MGNGNVSIDNYGSKAYSHAATLHNMKLSDTDTYVYADSMKKDERRYSLHLSRIHFMARDYVSPAEIKNLQPKAILRLTRNLNIVQVIGASTKSLTPHNAH